MQAPPPKYNHQDPAMRPPQMSQVHQPEPTASSTGAPFSAIGALLSQPYDSDDEDGRSIRNPHAYHGSPKAGSGDMRVQGGRPKSVVHFPGPQIGSSSTASSSGHARAPPPPHQQQQQQQPRYPNPSHPGPRSPHPHRPQPTLHIPPAASNKSQAAPLSPYALPKPSTPISPALAAAPDYFAPPRSAFSADAGAGSRSSVASSSPSITAYDSMEKTHSLMRGGEDELIAPVDTRRPRKRSPSGNILKPGAGAGGGARQSRMTLFGQPGGEFWKRFSVMAKFDSNKESDFLVTEKARKRRIRMYAIVGIVVIAVIIGAVAIGVTLTNNDDDDARPKSVNRPSDA